MHRVSDWASTTRPGGSVTDMSRRVVVIASGETERRALPYLVKHLAAEGVEVPGHPYST